MRGECLKCMSMRRMTRSCNEKGGAVSSAFNLCVRFLKTIRFIFAYESFSRLYTRHNEPV